MRQTVTVLSVGAGTARVAYDRPTACHNDCSHCEGGCGATAAKERVVVTAENPIGAGPGDRVIMEADSRAVYSAVFLVYVLPVVLFFTGYFGGEALGAPGALIGVLGFFLGLGLAVAASRRMTRRGREIRFRIVAFAES